MNTEVLETTYKSERVFAKGYCYSKIFFFFLIGAIVGVYYEQLLTLFTQGEWVSRKGLIYGPFNLVYGFGFALFYLFLGKNDEQRSWWKTYIYSCLIGGATEYFCSYFEQLFFHTESWNYSSYFLNIQGRTTIPFMLFWGFFGMLLLKVVYPFAGKYIEKIPYKIGQFIVVFMTIFIIFDSAISGLALWRETQREANIPATSSLQEFLDEYYPSSFLETIYPNMVNVKKP